MTAIAHEVDLFAHFPDRVSPSPEGVGEIIDALRLVYRGKHRGPSIAHKVGSKVAELSVGVVGYVRAADAADRYPNVFPPEVAAEFDEFIDEPYTAHLRAA